MLFELLAVGPVLWVALFVIAAAELFCFAQDDSEGLAVASVLAVGTFLSILLFTPLLVNIPITALVTSAVAYVVVGVAWSFKEWYDYLKEKLVEVKKYGENPSPEDLERWRPKAGKNKGRITGWMVLWPLYTSWWVLSLPRHMYTWIYEQLVTVYDNFAKRIFS